METLTTSTIVVLLPKKSIFIGIVLIFVNLIGKERTVYGQFCDPNCQRGIDQAYEQANDFHTKLTHVTDQLSTRIAKLDSEEKGVVSEVHVLASRVSRLENYLKGNISSAYRRIDDEVTYIYRELNNNMNSLYSNLTKKIDALSHEVHQHHPGHHEPTRAPPTHHTTTPQEVYQNLTKRIDGLVGPLSNLTEDNKIWRRNFRIVNSTFQRLRKCRCCG